MSEGNRYGAPAEVVEEMRGLIEEMGGLITQPFVPCANLNPTTDTMTILERDCSICEETAPGSAITLFRDNYNGEVVGVQISNWSKWSKDF